MKLNVEVKEGNIFKVTEYYSSYGANEQETVYIVRVQKLGKGNGMGLFDVKTGKQLFHGANSSYTFKLPTPEDLSANTK